MNPELWQGAKPPLSIEWDIDAYDELAGRLGEYAAELEQDPGGFSWDNGAFGGGDAFAYYGLVRHLQPNHVVEIGAGWSTLLLRCALEKNGGDAAVTVIEPYPSAVLLDGIPADWLVQKLVQDVDPAMFEQLGVRDIVFYDGSHVAGTGSDVNWMLFEVMPRLPPGVWVHFHDIFWPFDYHAAWVEAGRGWNEQYVLQAFLMHNDSWRVRLPMRMLRAERPARESWKLPSYLGGSVWLERIGSL